MSDITERLRANANEPWMSLGGRPFALEAAAEIERLRAAPITVRQVEAAAGTIMLHMFAPHELPLDAELRAKYMDIAKAALQAAERIRNQEATPRVE